MLEPGKLIAKLAEGFSGPVVFVDDFVGSGEQFLKTWERPYPCCGGQASFKQISVNSSATFFYCNAMATDYGCSRIHASAPEVKLSTGNVIPESYSLVSPVSLLWPEQIRAEGIALVEAVGRRLGYTADDGGEGDWRGFHQLGLALAFEHSIPDANIPIFFTDNHGWVPLVRRL